MTARRTLIAILVFCLANEPTWALLASMRRSSALPLREATAIISKTTTKTATSPLNNKVWLPNSSRPSHIVLRQSAKDNSGTESKSWRQALALVFSQRAAARTFSGDPSERRSMQLYTLLRVSIPSVLAGVAATLLFPGLSMGLATLMNDAGVFTVLSTDSSQFVQNFLTVAGLLFSILVGQTYCT